MGRALEDHVRGGLLSAVRIEREHGEAGGPSLERPVLDEHVSAALGSRDDERVGVEPAPGSVEGMEPRRVPPVAGRLLRAAGTHGHEPRRPPADPASHFAQAAPEQPADQRDRSRGCGGAPGRSGVVPDPTGTRRPAALAVSMRAGNSAAFHAASLRVRAGDKRSTALTER